MMMSPACLGSVAIRTRSAGRARTAAIRSARSRPASWRAVLRVWRMSTVNRCPVRVSSWRTRRESSSPAAVAMVSQRARAARSARRCVEHIGPGDRGPAGRRRGRVAEQDRQVGDAGGRRGGQPGRHPGRRGGDRGGVAAGVVGLLGGGPGGQRGGRGERADQERVGVRPGGRSPRPGTARPAPCRARGSPGAARPTGHSRPRARPVSRAAPRDGAGTAASDRSPRARPGAGGSGGRCGTGAGRGPRKPPSGRAGEDRFAQERRGGGVAGPNWWVGMAVSRCPGR